MTSPSAASILASAGFSIWDGGEGIQIWHKLLDADGESYLVLAHDGELDGPIDSIGWSLSHHKDHLDLDYPDTTLFEALATAAKIAADEPPFPSVNLSSAP